MIERVIEPSRIRRGRLAVNPVWIVHRDDGAGGRFQTKKAAAAFDASGCQHGMTEHARWCGQCRGVICGPPSGPKTKGTP